MNRFLHFASRLRLSIVPFDSIVAEIPEHGEILDVGCGSGTLALALKKAKPGVKIVGFDVNPLSIKKARSRLNSHGLPPNEVTFLNRDEFEARYANKTFDVVLLVDVLHHIPKASQESFLKSWFAHVKPNGMLVYKDMCARPRLLALANQIHDLIFAKQWIHHVHQEDIRRWATETGWRPLVEKRDRILWYGHEMTFLGRAEKI